MGFWFSSFTIDLIVAVTFLQTLLVLYLKFQFTFRKTHGIYQIDAKIPFGNTGDLILKRVCLGVGYKRIYDHFKELNLPYAGIYNINTSEFMPLEPELIKQLLVKEFQHFPDRGMFVDEETGPITGKMRMMFPAMVTIADEMVDVICQKVRTQEPVEFRDMLANFSTDIIGSCAFGLDCSCLQNANTNFRRYSKMAVLPQGFDIFRRILGFFFPKIIKFFKIPLINPKASKFFMGTVRETVRYREENNIVGKKFMHLCIQLKNFGRVSNDDSSPGSIKGDGKLAAGQGITVEEIVAQCLAFFVADYETTSTTIGFCLYELSKQPELQDKLREEIYESIKKHNGEYMYDAVMGMPYLDKVVNETLRKYPTLPLLRRKCASDFKVPNSDYTIRRGDKIRISLLGVHRDERYYPDPEKFDPERFSEEEKAKRPAMTYLPFGEGPRICIGMRFGLMETKVGVTSPLRHYKFKLNHRIPKPLPLIYMGPLLVTPGIWLDVETVTAQAIETVI